MLRLGTLWRFHFCFFCRYGLVLAHCYAKLIFVTTATTGGGATFSSQCPFSQREKRGQLTRLKPNFGSLYWKTASKGYNSGCYLEDDNRSKWVGESWFLNVFHTLTTCSNWFTSSWSIWIRPKHGSFKKPDHMNYILGHKLPWGETEHLVKTQINIKYQHLVAGFLWRCCVFDFCVFTDRFWKTKGKTLGSG